MIPAVYVTVNGSVFYAQGDELYYVPISATTGEPMWADAGIIDDFTELGRQAYRDSLSHVIGDNPAMRELWPIVPKAVRRRLMDDYRDGWNTERRETDPVAALTADVADAEQDVTRLRDQLAETTHARRLASLERSLADAQERRDSLAAVLDYAKQEQGR